MADSQGGGARNDGDGRDRSIRGAAVADGTTGDGVAGEEVVPAPVRTRSERVVETVDPVAAPAETVRRQTAPAPPERLVGANVPRDQVRWPAVIAGLLAGLTALLMLGLLATAIGLTVTKGGLPAGTAQNTAVWGGIAAIIAFLIGGFVAARAAAVFTRSGGALNGVMVFLLAVPVILWLAGQGLGAILGWFGGIPGGLHVAAGATASGSDVRVTAWATLIGFAVGLLASGIGGALGARGRPDFRRANEELVP
jgi:hypothetical protein